MMYLGNDPIGINQTDFLAHDTYIPDTDITSFSIDTHSTSWKHFLLVIKTLPYTDQPIRGFGLMYININGQYEVFTFNSSSGASYPNNTNTYELGTFTSINNGVVTKTGIASQTGKLIANTEYEWWCW